MKTKILMIEDDAIHQAAYFLGQIIRDGSLEKSIEKIIEESENDDNNEKVYSKAIEMFLAHGENVFKHEHGVNFFIIYINAILSLEKKEDQDKQFLALVEKLSSDTTNFTEKRLNVLLQIVEVLDQANVLTEQEVEMYKGGEKKVDNDKSKKYELHYVIVEKMLAYALATKQTSRINIDTDLIIQSVPYVNQSVMGSIFKNALEILIAQGNRASANDLYKYLIGAGNAVKLDQSESEIAKAAINNVLLQGSVPDLMELFNLTKSKLDEVDAKAVSSLVALDNLSNFEDRFSTNDEEKVKVKVFARVLVLNTLFTKNDVVSFEDIEKRLDNQFKRDIMKGIQLGAFKVKINNKKQEVNVQYVAFRPVLNWNSISSHIDSLKIAIEQIVPDEQGN